MRRLDREIKDWTAIVDIFERADTIRLAVNGSPHPYVVPLSFGYEDCGDSLNIYVHGAKEGLKHDLIQKNKNVCIEADIFHGYVELKAGLTAEYESVIGFGTAEAVHGDEVVKGMDLICSHCGYDKYEYDKSKLELMRIYKISVKEITGKRNFVQE